MGLLTDIHRVAAEIIARIVVYRLINDAGGSRGDSSKIATSAIWDATQARVADLRADPDRL
jgi:hypothetical protein